MSILVTQMTYSSPIHEWLERWLRFTGKEISGFGSEGFITAWEAMAF